MDEVARIERSRPDEDGNAVESSFHPCLPVDDKSIVRPKEKHRRRRRMKKEASTNGQTNGDAEKRNGKGKEVERHPNSPLSGEAQEELGKFYPYHYFDYIAGTSTGGYVTWFRIPTRICSSLTILQIERNYAWAASDERG